MLFLDPILANTDDAAYRFGQVIGFLIFFLGGILGIAKCFSIMKRPTTQSACVFSLALFLACWVLSAVLTMVSEMGDGPSVVLVILLRVLIFLAFVGSLVCAIVGLCLYDKQRHQQGRAQAIWSLALFSLVLMIGIGGVVVTIATKAKKMSAMDSGGIPGEVVKVEKFNFSIQPPKGWVQVNPVAFNTEACVAMRRLRPELYGMVLAEHLVIEQEQMVELAKSNLEVAAKVISQTERVEKIGELEFTCLKSKAMVEGVPVPLNYENWICAHGGMVWQVVFWSSIDSDELAREVRPVVDSFKLLDKDSNANPATLLSEVERPEHGYRASLEGLGWQDWVDEEGSVDYALYDLRAERALEILMLMPLRIEGKVPPMHALRHGVMSTIGFENISQDALRIRDWDPGSEGQGQEIEFESKAEEAMVHYKLRIARFESQVYFIVGWVVQPNGDMDLLTRSMDRVEWIPVSGEPAPLAKEAVAEKSTLFNEIGITLYNKEQYSSAAQWFEFSYGLKEDAVVLGNVGDAYEMAQQAGKGRAFLAGHVDKHSSNHYLGMQYARLMAIDGNLEGAQAKFSQMLEQGFASPDDFLAWLNLLSGMNHYDAAIHAADEWVKRNPSRDARRWRAQTYSAAGQNEKAIELHEELCKEFPKDLKIACSMAELYNDAGESQKAKAQAEAVLKENAESVRAMLALGWSQMGLKWYRDAKETFEKAALLEPDNEDVKYAIKAASASLGEGDNSEVKRVIEPLELPSPVADELRKLAEKEVAGDGHPHVWLKRWNAYYFEEGKRAKRTVGRKVAIKTVEGAKGFSSVSYRFNPLHEGIHLNRLQVFNAEGKVIPDAGAKDVYVRDEQDGMATDYKVLHIQVAGVKPGVVVEWEVTIQDKGTSDEFEFQRELFAGGAPTLGHAVVVLGDVDKVRSDLERPEGIRASTGDGWRSWIQGGRDADVFESYEVPAERHYPMLRLASSKHQWQKLGEKYLEDIKGIFEKDEEIVKLAKELTKEAKTDRAKVAAILNNVQKSVGYQAIEFGVRGRMPNSAAKTLELRYGDCKDMSVLTTQLLSAAGVKANLALVDTDWTVGEKTPSMDQFNHMVVHAPSLGEKWLVDPTEKHLDQSRFPATGFWSNQALILDPGNVRMIELTAHAPTEGCEITSRRKLTADEKGWRVEETLELTGYTASWMRYAFIGMHPDEQRNKAQRLLAAYGSVQVSEFAFLHLEDVSKPATLKLKYRVLGGVTELAGHQMGALPAIWEKDYLATKFMDERDSNFRIQYGYRFKSEVEIALPDGSRAVDLDKWSRSKKSEFSNWSLKADAKGNAVKVVMDFKAKPGEFEAKAYRSFHDAWEQPRIAWDKPLSWTVKVAKDGNE